MEKKIKFIFVLLLVIISIIIIKNIFLYFRYNHGMTCLIRDKSMDGKIIYSNTIDTWLEDEDMRNIITVQIDDSYIGNYTIKQYYLKCDGSRAFYYSWRSLLPFDTNTVFYSKSEIILDSSYIVFLPNDNTGQDTVYTKYKMNKDSLFIDKERKYYRYENDHEWGFIYSEKPSFIKLFYFWEF